MTLPGRVLNSLRWRMYYGSKPVRRWWARLAAQSAPLEREILAHRYLQGEGIEIGALNLPLAVPKSARVRYVDRMPAAELRRQYPELAKVDLVHVDIVDNGETLATVPDRSQDFVIANHFLEHCQDPIRAAGHFARVLRENGILYLAIPEKRFTFDVDRPPTSLEHLIRDHEEGPGWSRSGHFEEWARLVQKVGDEEAVRRQAAHLVELDYSIHFHVWTQLELLQLIRFLMIRCHLQMEAFVQNGLECLVILRKIQPWPHVTPEGAEA